MNNGFKDGKYMSASQKERAWKRFKKVIDTMDTKYIDKNLYEQLHLRMDFIAHYNIHGFRETYSGDDFRHFINRVANVSLWDNDMQDINKKMKDYARANYQKVMDQLNKAQAKKEIELLTVLAAKHGATLIYPDSESGQLTIAL